MRLISILLLLIASSITVAAQKFDGKGRRPFNDLRPIYTDLDKDGKVDVIKPRTYQTNRGRKKIHWITFDAKLSSGKKQKRFFKYEYGYDDVTYWVYALRPLGDINRDGKRDLLFYSGDDTGDETVVMVSKGNRYVVRSRRTTDSDDW